MDSMQTCAIGDEKGWQEFYKIHCCGGQNSLAQQVENSDFHGFIPCLLRLGELGNNSLLTFWTISHFIFQDCWWVQSLEELCIQKRKDLSRW